MIFCCIFIDLSLEYDHVFKMGKMLNVFGCLALKCNAHSIYCY